VVQDLDAESIGRSGQQVTELPARLPPGLPMLVAGFVTLLPATALAVVASQFSGAPATGLVLLCTLVLLAGVLVLRGIAAPSASPACIG
jgi:hypothetical protein